MSQTVTLGAPSLTGEDVNLLVSALFADAAYPLTVQVQNHMPRDVVFPEVSGLFLRHVANAAGSRATAVIADHDQFQRLASSVAQIAELNGYARALTLTAAGTVGSAAPQTAQESDAAQPQEEPSAKPSGKRGRPAANAASDADHVA